MKKLMLLYLIILNIFLFNTSLFAAPIHDAIEKGDLETVNALLAKGADVNAKDDRGRSALMYAAILQNLDMVKALVDKGAEINAKDKAGKTALTYASEAGKTDIAKYLQEKIKS